MYINATKKKINIRDSAYGFTYEGTLLLENYYYNSSSAVFCEDYGNQTGRILLYKYGLLKKIAQDTKIIILYSNLNIDQIVFMIKGKNEGNFLMELYIFDRGKITLLASKADRASFSCFLIDNKVIINYLVPISTNTMIGKLWDLYTSDINGNIKKIETNILCYSTFITKEKEIKYLITKCAQFVTDSFSGYYDDGAFKFIIIKGKERIEFDKTRSDLIGCTSLLGTLALLVFKETKEDPEDKFLIRKISTYSLFLINTDSFEKIFLDKTTDFQKFRFTNNLWYAGEFIDLDNVAQCGISIDEQLMNRYPQYFRSGKKNLVYPYNIFFSKTDSESFYIAMELVPKADRALSLESQYPLDDSQNFIVSYLEDNKEEYFLMQELLDNKYDESSYIKYRIYGIDIKEIIKNCECKFYWIMVHDLKNYNYIQNIIASLEKYYQVNSQYQLIEILKNEIVDNYCIFKRYLIEEKKETYYQNSLKQIMQKMIIENRLPSKWKSEQDLFRLINRIFDDAIFHYTEDWINPQHIDIFIPQINCAFEYQGQQHYMSMDYFGGESAFKKRIELDERKKKLCSQNGITLLEWQYDEPITESMLNDKLYKIGIDFRQPHNKNLGTMK
jgi:hypothetical protein